MSQTAKQPSGLLVAVYDFALSRVSFDFFGFLVMAELKRREKGLEGVHLVLVPADGDGFHPNLQYGLDQKKWRLKNIIIDGCWLLPSCRQLSVYQDREQARAAIAGLRGPVFPDGYSIENPVPQWQNGWSIIEAHKGNDPRVLEASAQAHAYIAEWRRAHAGERPLVSLTLREASHNAQRNVELSTWIEFAGWLENEGYFPVLVRDTETALLPKPAELGKLADFPAAAFNLDLRMALYEAAFLNLGVTNGPGQLCNYSQVTRSLTFVTGEWMDVEPTPMLGSAVDRDESPAFLSKYQRWIWKKPELEILKMEFDKMARTLNGIGEASAQPSDEALRLPLIEVARRFHKTGEWDLFEAAAADALEREDAAAEVHYLRGLAARARSGGAEAAGGENWLAHFDAASQALDAAGKPAAEAARAVRMRAHMALLTGDYGAAENWLLRLSELEPADGWAHAELARARAEQGRAGEALAALGATVAGGLESAECMEQMARLHQAEGRFDEAIIHYRRAIDLEAGAAGAYLGIGMIFEAVDQPAEAKHIYQLAIDNGAGNPLIRSRLDKVLAQPD